MATDLSPEAFLPRLTTKWLGREYLYDQEVDSTNARLDALAQEGAPHGTVMVAESQTAGRGRLGRTWHSPPEQNIYFSLLLRPGWEAAQTPPLSLTVGVALAEAIDPLLVDQPTLKWPNDVLYDGCKLAGILVETALKKGEIHHVVVGIGLNVNEESFPDPLSGLATSLQIASGREWDRGEVLAALLRRLEQWLDRLDDEGSAGAINAWTRWAPWLGSEITTRQGEETITGVALGIDDQGALCLRDHDGEVHVIRSGEILRSA